MVQKGIVMEQIEKIYGSINKVMEDIGAVGKNRQNEKQKYMFRGIDDVMNALYPALIKNKVFAVPNVKNKQREERKSSGGNNIIYTIVEVEYSFFSAEDGSSIEFIVYGEGMDSGDKSMNKAMSAAFKYACFQLFCIPTEELKDSEIDSFEVKDYQLRLQGKNWKNGDKPVKHRRPVQAYRGQRVG